jgi:DNA-binding transcriptional ArsR family regulator
MTMIATVEPSLAAACLFHGFGDRSRVAIIRRLLDVGEQRVVDLTEHVGLAQSTVSKHLACLADCGVVTITPRGRASAYSLAFPDETRQVLVAAEALLAATGNAVVLCANHCASTISGD